MVSYRWWVTDDVINGLFWAILGYSIPICMCTWNKNRHLASPNPNHSCFVSRRFDIRSSNNDCLCRKPTWNSFNFSKNFRFMALPVPQYLSKVISRGIWLPWYHPKFQRNYTVQYKSKVLFTLTINFFYFNVLFLTHYVILRPVYNR